MKRKREMQFLLEEIEFKRFELLCLETWLENASLRACYCENRRLCKELDRVRRAVSRWLTVSGSNQFDRQPLFCK